MSGIYDPIDSLVSDIKRSTDFLDRLLFPKIGLFIGMLGLFTVIVLLLK
jgi:hypothetical protein